MMDKKILKKIKYHQKLAQTDKYNYHPHGNYIGNSNTLIYHNPDCKDIKMMLNNHIIPTNNTQTLYRPCSHCKPNNKQKQFIHTQRRCMDMNELETYQIDKIIEKETQKREEELIQYLIHQGEII